MAVTIVGQALAHLAVGHIAASVLTCVKSSLGPLGFGLVVIELCESSHTLRKPLPKGLFLERMCVSSWEAQMAPLIDTVSPQNRVNTWLIGLRT